MTFTPAEFLDLEHTAHSKLFEGQQYVWDALKQIAKRTKDAREYALA